MGLPLNHGHSTHATSSFQPSQIVGLAYETSCLYAEVVQIIESRQSCWVRPLVLVLHPVENQPQTIMLPGELEWYDLRQDADLLLPLTLFRVVLDVEVLPWLAHLYADNPSAAIHSDHPTKGHQHFRELIQQIWQANPDVFRATSHLRKP